MQVHWEMYKTTVARAEDKNERIQAGLASRQCRGFGSGRCDRYCLRCCSHRARERPANTFDWCPVKQPDFSALTFTVNGSKFLYGEFINALLLFLIIAAAVYLFVVMPINALITRSRKAPVPADPTTRKCSECLSEIPIGARRCAFCTSTSGQRSLVEWVRTR